MRIGIFGGTFDPFHCGHYEIVKEALSQKLVDKVIVIPTVVDYYRKDKSSMFNVLERQKIINYWFTNASNVILDFSEYNSETINSHNRRYVDTLRYVVHKYREKNSDQFFTIIGTDSFYNFNSWTSWKEILKLSKLIVVQRDTTQITSEDHINEVYAIPHQVLLIDNKFLSVSASKIREHLDKMCESMSIGPSGLPINIYLDEIDEYKRTGKTFEEQEIDLKEQSEKISETLKKSDSQGNASYSELEYESLRDKALEMASILKRIEQETHMCAMCKGDGSNGSYSADEYLKNICEILYSSQGYHKQEL